MQKHSDTYESLGIVLDANGDLKRKREKLKAVFSSDSYVRCTPPEAPHPLGTIVEFQKHRRVGVWLMPDNHAQGAC